MYVVTVNLTIKHNRIGEFLLLIKANAKKSVELEVDCLLFDVAISTEKQNSVFLYEVYKNEQAFAKHLNSAHFKEFDATTSDMVEFKEVKTYNKC